MSGTYAEAAARGSKRCRAVSPSLSVLRSRDSHSAVRVSRDEEEVTLSQSPEPREEFPALPSVASSPSSFLLPLVDTDRGPFLPTATSSRASVEEVKPVLRVSGVSGGLRSPSFSPPSCRFERRSPNLRPSKVRRVEARGSIRGVPPPLSLSSFFAESLAALVSVFWFLFSVLVLIIFCVFYTL
jgi:hypothetical protein